MRILLTTDTIGGVWTFTRELSRCLLEQGHAVALVSFGAAPSAIQQAWCSDMRRIHGPRFFYSQSDAPLEWMQGNERTLGAGSEMLRIAEEFDATVLHTNQFCWGALTLPMPRIITAHSDVMSWASACKPSMRNDSSPWLSRYSDLVQRGLDGADVVVAPTQWMLSELQRFFRIGNQRLVIANGRDVQAPRCERKLQAVTVGRLWDEAKGLPWLAEIRSSMPIVVAGETSFDGALAQVGSRLEAAGMLSETQLVELFATSSVYVAASIYEPFGLAPLEAALCGCAVVARDLPSFHEVWGEAALYFDSHRSLEALLEQLAAHARALHAAQQRSLTKAKSYSAERTAAAYVQLYRRALERTSQGPEALHAA